MTLTPISLGLKSNPARYGHGSAARLINCYAEEAGDDAKAPWNIFAVDGLASFATLTNGSAIRAMLALTSSDLYVVSGRLVFRIEASGTATLLGGIASDGMVTMARNRLGDASGPQIAICCDGLYYIIQNGLLRQMGDPDLPPPVSVCSLNGYFSFLLADGRHFASELDDADVTALSFAATGSNPDPGVRNWVRGQDLCLGGTRSIEFWRDVGGDPYPFERTTSIDVGVLAAASVADIDQNSAFVAHDGTVRMLNGYQAQRISTHAVERFIADEWTVDEDGYAIEPSTLSACSWQYGGHTHYALSGANGTWVYDATTQLWHERQSYGLTRWRGAQSVLFGTKRIIGDYAAGTLYEMRADAYTEAGADLVATVQFPIVHAFPYRMRHNALHIDVVPGVGLVSDGSVEQTDAIEVLWDDGAAVLWDDGTYMAWDDTDTVMAFSANVTPQMMIDYSDDGGATWSTQRFADLGEMGDRLKRVKVTRLGMTRARTYRLSISAAVARCILSASLDAEKAAA